MLEYDNNLTLTIGNIVENIFELKEKVFQNINFNYLNKEWLSERFILPTSDIVYILSIITGNFYNERVFIPKIPLNSSNNYHFEFKRLQFPIKLCYAMTINKSQGQTLKVIGLELTSGCFTHGQLYVACSRVTNEDNLYILTENGKTKNIVYKEALC